MDIERNDTFLPVLVLREDAEKIALMKAAINACADECEHILRSFEKRILAGKKKIDFCTKESNDIELQLNELERKIFEAQLLTQESESEKKCQEKWKNLRDTYRRRKKRQPSGSSQDFLKPWPYFQAMSFLEQFIQRQETTSNISIPEEYMEDSLTEGSFLQDLPECSNTSIVNMQEAVQTVKENRNIKRKIIALKNDLEEQEKLLKRANETIQEVKNNAESNKKVKVLQDVSA